QTPSNEPVEAAEPEDETAVEDAVHETLNGDAPPDDTATAGARIRSALIDDPTDLFTENGHSTAVKEDEEVIKTTDVLDEDEGAADAVHEALNEAVPANGNSTAMKEDEEELVKATDDAPDASSAPPVEE
ncbi:hypothetical protein H0H93_009760, partial [Arthromyces matolae]